MLSSQIQFHWYANQKIIITSKKVCSKMQLFFEKFEWKRLNLIKWQITNLNDIIFINSSLLITGCLRKLYIEINIIQRDIKTIYKIFIHLRKNIIWACREHSTLINNFTNSFIKTAILIDNLFISIINYKIVHKGSQSLINTTDL